MATIHEPVETLRQTEFPMPITNRVTEKDLRDHLIKVGYYGRSAKIHELELVAIKRPGWVQVFRGHLDAKHQDNGWTELFVVIRDDEREKIEFGLFESPEERDEQMRIWSEGLVALDRGERSPVAAMLAAGVIVLLLLLGVVKLVANFS